MDNPKQILKARLKSAEKLAVLGIGSELMGDDCAGVKIAKKLEQLNTRPEKFRAFVGAGAPENLTGAIAKFKPTHLIMIDCADLRKAPGTIELIEPANIGGVSFSTHRLPTKILIDYLTKTVGCRITVVGIQPKSINFGRAPSPEINQAIDEIVGWIKELIPFFQPRDLFF